MRYSSSESKLLKAYICQTGTEKGTNEEVQGQQTRSEIREIDQKMTTSANCEEGTVIPELVFPATQGAVQETPISMC